MKPDTQETDLLNGTYTNSTNGSHSNGANGADTNGIDGLHTNGNEETRSNGTNPTHNGTSGVHTNSANEFNGVHLNGNGTHINGTSEPPSNQKFLNGSSNDSNASSGTSQAESPIPIAICGMACRLPAAYTALSNNGNSSLPKVTPRPAFQSQDLLSTPTVKPGSIESEYGYFLDKSVDLGSLDGSFFNFGRTKTERADPHQRKMLEVVLEVVDDAGETNFRGELIGCYMGSVGEDWIEMWAKEPQHMTIRTGCSAALVGLHEACVASQRGDCISAIVSGANLTLAPNMTAAMTEQGVLSPDGSCKSFSADANGYGRCEANYIKPLDAALCDNNPIRVVIRKTATNHDAYRDANLDTSKTAFVECHGTSTPVGDPIEANAVARVFGDAGVYIGSVKPDLRHSQRASRLSSLLKAVMTLKHLTIPSTSSSRPPTRTFHRDERVSVNSFGIRGANAHVIIDSARRFNIGWKANNARRTPYLLVCRVGPAPGVITVFTGQGAQWPLIAKQLLQTNDIFKSSIRPLDKWFRSTPSGPGWELEEELLKLTRSSRIETAQLSQPACTAIQLGMIDWLVAICIKPVAVFGHSGGEIAAAYAAGALTAREAIVAAWLRGAVTLQQKREGAMAVIGLGWDEAEPYLVPGVVRACENSTKSIMLSGDSNKVETVIAAIHKANPDVPARVLMVNKTYHSYHMAEIGDDYNSQQRATVSDWYEFTIASHNCNSGTKHCTGQVKSPNEAPVKGSSQGPFSRTLGGRKVTIPWAVPASTTVASFVASFVVSNTSQLGQEATATILNNKTGDEANYHLHPVIIDACLQLSSVAATKGFTKKPVMSVPVMIEKLIVYRTAQNIHFGVSAAMTKFGAIAGEGQGFADCRAVLQMEGTRLAALDDGSADQGRTDQATTRYELGLHVDFIDPKTLIKSNINETDYTSHLEELARQLESVDVSALDKFSDQDIKTDIGALIDNLADTPAVEVAVAIHKIRISSDITDILSGTLDAMEFMLADDTLAKVLSSRDYFDRSAFLRQLAHTKTSLKILEIGAGTSAPTGGAWADLSFPDGRVFYLDYTITDLSSRLLLSNKDRTVGIPNVHHAVLKLGQDPVEQGFREEQYDLVIATNSIHATKSLAETLKCVRKLIQPNGELLLQELNPTSKWPNFVFAAGFDEPIVLEGSGKYHLRVNSIIVAKPSKYNEEAEKVVTIPALSANSTASALSEILTLRGFAVQECGPGEKPPPEQDVIVILGNPEYARVVGAARTIRSEKAVDFATCEIDDVDASLVQAADVFGQFLSEMVVNIGRYYPFFLNQELLTAVDCCGERSYCAGCKKARSADRFCHFWSGLLRFVVQYLQDGHVLPIRPINVFGADAVQDALRYMQRGLHIGKIVVSIRGADGTLKLDSSNATRPKVMALDKTGSYLLVGGLGGLGRAISRWMVEHGARNLVCLSRSSGSRLSEQATVREVESMGANVSLVQGSVSVLEDVKRAIAAAPTLKGILQMSIVLHDNAVPRMTHGDWTTAVEPKIQGTWNLHNATIEAACELDFLLLFSSISGIIGQLGQASYARASAFLDTFVQCRTDRGLPASTIDIGDVTDTSVISDDDALRRVVKLKGACEINE
ncbi:hypothetical protein G7046_g5503 [Stylonectria norvegica]|nr:hypothetical protein G7046_g5503 [Stylonectria norvegica]